MKQSAAEFRFHEGPSFGLRLRAARQARGLELETCGRALHLPQRVLRQLESDDLSGIDSQIYLGGYLRKYGRYLDIAESEIEAAIARLKPGQPKLVSTGGVPHSRYLLDQYAKAATYVVLTLVIAAPTAWLGMRGTLTHDISRLAPLDATPVAQQDGSAPSSSAANPATHDATAIAQVPVLAPIASASVRSLVPSQQPLLASMVPMPNIDNEMVLPKHADGDTPATSTGSGAHSLTLTLTDESWVAVLGKDGTRLEYGLLPAGTRKTYRSDQPLEVRIGNANGVQAAIDDEPIALDAYRRANIAHFRIDIQDGKAVPAGV